MQVNNPLPPDRMYDDSGNLVRCKKVSIGTWDMDTDAIQLVTHGITDITKIISINGIIWNDAQSQVYIISPYYVITGIGLMDLAFQFLAVPTISILRNAGSVFDGVAFSSAVINRGFLYIWYLE